MYYKLRKKKKGEQCLLACKWTNALFHADKPASSVHVQFLCSISIGDGFCYTAYCPIQNQKFEQTLHEVSSV